MRFAAKRLWIVALSSVLLGCQPTPKEIPTPATDPKQEAESALLQELGIDASTPLIAPEGAESLPAVTLPPQLPSTDSDTDAAASL